jgi:hypothetical protein
MLSAAIISEWNFAPALLLVAAIRKLGNLTAAKRVREWSYC